ncbi:MAG: DUF309 domain-containing protein [Thermoproteus sp.]
MAENRYLFIVDNPGIDPAQRAQLLRDLRGVLSVLNLRVASDHIEVVVRSTHVAEAKNKIEEVLGRVREVLDITIEENIGRGDIRRFVDLFNSERFWEAHAEIEPLWRKNGDVALQALILICAAFIKIQEGLPDKFVRLAEEARRLLEEAPPRVGCIDLNRLREDLATSIMSKRPFKIACL